MSMQIQIDQLTFDESGLIPAIIQDATTGDVLMLGYMNQESLTKTLETKETWFFSRSRQTLWNKGATSGNRQTVQSIAFDCDVDSLLIQVDPQGPACHTGEPTCFYRDLFTNKNKSVNRNVVHDVTNKIKQRRENPVDGAYTTYLFNEGIDKVLKKVGEETSEVIIGAKNNDKQEVVWEIADLTYHTLVLMEMLGVSINDIKAELNERHIQKEGNQRE
ncbi:bifunctional phosphoribosyl-AMP cyclohydrolase/phosphoribosyl-ATP pyrophosphatase [Virgibacillus phasianinus]|uniref:Histidine biosynthesis bifunctional protein HisIE n=1 Tax=Virgibacillus phasianinus TaxID=2017483 RepID=A0A220U084_9BACI|nr:bifunctional phosphoribosyl-AMP cyclohydrolase/phosphoribosyl-ATP diphosphatase HisIE [Virgibacillus phasianinus]ASK61422.1 bifunctional phosphoribosyl-AMP cyclohydrolase/phosphoribosyl-ATP pyrophosphatase [Virgibacillus phasianinus]